MSAINLGRLSERLYSDLMNNSELFEPGSLRASVGRQFKEFNGRRVILESFS